MAIAIESAGRRHLAAGLALAGLVVVLDQASKWWVVQEMTARGGQPAELTSFFAIVLVHNRGVSFGMFNNDAALNGIVFSVLAAAIVAALLVWLWRAAGALVVAGIGLVVGGAVGNVIDRLRLGAVVDFLDFHLAGWHFPAFNLADSAITIGVGLMIVDGLLTRRTTPR